MARSTIIHLNSLELNYNPFMINLDKFNVSCNVFDSLSSKICVPSKAKDMLKYLM